MPGIGDILKGPFTGIIDSVSGLIGKFVTDPTEKLKVQSDLDKLTSDFNLRMAELDTQFASLQASVVIAEAKSESWLTRNWRPILMMTFNVIIAYNYIVAPMFTLHSTPIPPNMWQLLTLGIGGYIFGRSGEKMVPQIIDAVKK